MAANVLTNAGANVVMLEAGGPWDNTKDSQMMKWPYQSPRRGGKHERTPLRRVRRLHRRLGHRRRALHAGRGHDVRLVSRAHARRPHQSLGPDLAALRPRRLQGQVTRRSWRRLADFVRRHGALLRQSRRPHRRVRIERGAAQSPRWKLPPRAASALPRTAREGGVGQAQRDVHSVATFDSHEAHSWPRCLPLLRPVQSRLHIELELHVAERADLPRDENGEAHPAHQRDGARGDHE